MTRPLLSLLLLALGACAATGADAAPDPAVGPRVRYLEVVTPDVDATCATYAQLFGVTFGEPVASLGDARTAALAGGGSIGVRAPMHGAEEPDVRAYFLVDDLEDATEAAVGSGATVAVPPMEIPGEGRCALLLQGGVLHALWQD